MEQPVQMSHRRNGHRLAIAAALLLAAALLAAGLLALAFRPHTIHGKVTDAAGPVAGATVRVRGSLASTTTDAVGRFTLTFRGPALHRVITAWQEAYFPAGADLMVAQRSGGAVGQQGGGLALALKPHPVADDPSYDWLTSEPDPNVALGCGHCMVEYNEWKPDAHALSATNPRFLSIYNGTDLAGQPAGGPGFRRDSPADPGNCANCHAPAAALAHNGSADMNRLSGVETEGVPCDLCHKIGDVTLGEAGLPHQGLPGIQSYRLYRPAAGTQIFFGTLDDIPRRVSYSQLEKESRFCAPCHSGGWWGVSAYASYDEWLASPYAAEGVTCQACHMPPAGGSSILTSPCAPAKPEPAGWPELSDLLCRARACVECHRKPADDPARNPLPVFSLIPERPASTIHTHQMTGVRDEAFMRASVAMTVTATQGPDGVRVDVAIANVGAGHDIPTDSPMRNMILVVTARDAQGNSLSYLGDRVVPAWGGTDCRLSIADCGSRVPGSEIAERESQSGNYAGLPGKGYAKILEDWDGTAPAPQWRNGVRILSDNRIPARTADRSAYTFVAPADGKPARVEARLIFRRAFKPWMDAKGWNEPDLVLAEAKITAAATTQAAPTAPPLAPTPLFPPAQATTADGKRLRLADFAAPQDCVACHPEAGQAWQASGHAAATTESLYRAWFKAADQTTQGQISPFCAGCHTPVGLLSGQIRSRWAWSGRDLYPLDATARGGVTCVVCHSLGQMGIGNASYVMEANAILGTDHAASRSIPLGRSTQHALPDPQSQVPTPQLCAPCHEATNPRSGLPVMTTYSEWRASRFNTGEPATTTTCQGCHFADGRHGELRPEDLKQAARVSILPPAEMTPGKDMELKVSVSNVGAGHDLPTGAAELRKVWLAVTVTDATGREVYRSGATDVYGDPVEGSVTYGMTWQDATGLPTDRLWEAESLLNDYRISAGETVTETYRFPLSAGTQRPLRIRAVLNYRASAGYLSALMTTYLGEDVPSAPIVELAAAETTSE
jgi:hypothetical protein